LVIIGSPFLRTYHGVSDCIYIIRLEYYVVLKYLCIVDLKLFHHASVHNR
jgi:hypothetical protein